MALASLKMVLKKTRVSMIVTMALCEWRVHRFKLQAAKIPQLFNSSTSDIELCLRSEGTLVPLQEACRNLTGWRCAKKPSSKPDGKSGGKSGGGAGRGKARGRGLGIRRNPALEKAQIPELERATGVTFSSYGQCFERTGTGG
eukprot:s2081_g2.t1